MRLLVTGAGGLLGGRLAELLSRAHTVIAGVHVSRPPDGLETVPIDLLQPTSIEAAFDDARPDAVLHCAALADADRCEADPELALRMNVHATDRLAVLCARRGARLVALSTDMVLGGDKAFSSEADAALPRQVYGRTKQAAEAAVLARSSAAVVVRVALVHGRGHGPRRTASESIADALRSGRRLRLFTDQHRTPVDPESVAAAVASLLASRAGGVFNVGGPERLSRHELGLRVAKLLGLPAGLIDPVTQPEPPQGARRPADVSLDSSRARRELGFAPRPLDLGVRESRV
ncbi:MAG TPA: sugar nucleotide-binding protein [Vicinamibacteria bacterium]|nr:sugar nucleotide-binding protein [Vicinamibacteria bacterium]